jgi:hypothetical protein
MEPSRVPRSLLLIDYKNNENLLDSVVDYRVYTIFRDLRKG